MCCVPCLRSHEAGEAESALDGDRECALVDAQDSGHGRGG